MTEMREYSLMPYHISQGPNRVPLDFNEPVLERVVNTAQFGRNVEIGPLPEVVQLTQDGKGKKSEAYWTSNDVKIGINFGIVHMAADAKVQSVQRVEGARSSLEKYRYAYAGEMSSILAFYMRKIARDDRRKFLSAITLSAKAAAAAAAFIVGGELGIQSMENQIHSLPEAVKMVVAIPLMWGSLLEYGSLKKYAGRLREAGYSKKDVAKEFIPRSNPHLVTLVKGEVAFLLHRKDLIVPKVEQATY